MAQKKSYSRYFIILQEDEKGYSLASDKIASGYAKLEMKNEKCKISYYVQNLKKEKTPYYMILICNKKDMKNIIKIGEMNIDDYGRADICYEYPMSNVAGSGVSMDKVSGAAIVRMLDNNIVSVMSGFASTEIPEWKTFRILEDRSKNLKEKENKDVEELKTVKPEKVEDKSIFDKYEESIERAKTNKENIKEDEKDIKDIKEAHLGEKEEKLDNVVQVEDSEEKKVCKKSEDEKDMNKEIPNYEKDNDEVEKNNKEVIEDVFESKIKKDLEMEDIEYEIPKEDSSIYVDDSSTEAYEKAELNRHKYENKEGMSESVNYPKGPEGDFFNNLTNGFKETKNISKELKRCKWYKVPVSSMEDMYNMNDYNKYALIYYPMIGYYPYIKKHCQYLMGYKCDKKGRVKYLIYGILGTKDKRDQPYGGKSGFVTWISLKDKNKTGYWLMFYDFKTNTVIIPVRK
ncbi:hypothetical protein AB8U03_04075 [Clostridium sp. Mt-5]|uniref:DUF7922 domain-containing protein n=1 Tax=Clostridium moutaii TaxID=3240932 RepID=A0ABV4BMT1_9CLOT